MKERPILFSAPMVRAILAGNKTVTRRVAKPQPVEVLPAPPGSRGLIHETCPYGQPGDRIWVRETWAETDRHDGTPVVAYCAGGCLAVGRREDRKDFLIPGYAWSDTPEPDRWRPSIHMPRWASRITLEITGVRVERLQDISEADALAEGIAPVPGRPAFTGGSDWWDTPIDAFGALWESISGADSWDTNPWVWVVEFKRIAQGEPA